MAIDCDPASLAEAAKCFNQGYGPLVLKAFRIRLLCAFLNGETMTCTPDALSELVGCFLEMDAGTLDAIETYLTCQVANAGGGGGGTDYNSDGAVDPSAAPTDPTKTNTYTNTVAGSFWVWPAGGAAWQQLL